MVIMNWLFNRTLVLGICQYQASQSWVEWLMKKRKAFDQRGDMAISAWAEQQHLEMTLRARHLSRSKVFFLIETYKEIICIGCRYELCRPIIAYWK
jgi:hypothetical protein